MRTPQRMLSSGIAVMALLVTACGSTVPIQQQLAAEQSAEQGLADAALGIGAESELGGVDSADSGFPELGSGDLPEITGGSTGVGSVSGREPTTTTAAGTNGPGVTAATIKIGLSFAEDAGTANETVGAAANSFNARRAYDGLIEDLNTRGGINGRKIVPVYHRFETTSAEPWDQQDQEACAHWTQDDKVFAADSGLGTENIVSCLEKAGAVILRGEPNSAVSDRFYARYPHYVRFAGIDLNDLSELFVDSLYRMGYFTEGAKLGLVTFDTPDHVYAAESSFMPALRRHGLELTDVAYVKQLNSLSDFGELTSQTANAALRFKSEGITHVMLLDGNSRIAFAFMQAAERQEYRPRYGLTSMSGPTGRAADQEPAQLRGSVGIGWAPNLDVGPEDEPAFAQKPNRERCLALMKKNGVATANRNTAAQAFIACDTIWFLEATLGAAGNVLNQDTYLNSLTRVGSGYDPAITFGTTVSATRRDGLGAVANLKYIDGCTCFRYTSKPFAVPN